MKLVVFCSAQQLRLFRRGAPYPTREERSSELKDALDRYDLRLPGVSVTPAWSARFPAPLIQRSKLKSSLS